MSSGRRCVRDPSAAVVVIAASLLTAPTAEGAAQGQPPRPEDPHVPAHVPALLPTSVPIGEDGPRTSRTPEPYANERFTWMQEPFGGWTHVSSPTNEYRVPDEMTGGVVLFDADQDGDLDVFLATGGTWRDLQPDAPFPGHALFRNDLAPCKAPGPKNVLKFTNVAREAGVFGEAGSYCLGATAADLDNDGDQDLFVTGLERCFLYRNDGVVDGIPRFTECAEQLGLRNDGRWATSACFLDADRDGRLDLYVAHYLVFSIEANRSRPCDVSASGKRDYCGPKDFCGVQDAYYHQEPDGRFRECALEVGLEAPKPLSTNAKGLGVIATDFDDDADVDLYVANDMCPNLLFVNDGTGRFTEEALARGCALSEEGRSQASMGVDAGDFDGDGDLDLFTTNLDLELNALYRNDGAGGFTDDVRRSGLAAGDRGEVGFGTDFFDFDNDGDLDLAIANGHVLSHVHKTRGTLFYEQCDQLFENDGKGRFRLVAPKEAGAYFDGRNVARGLATGDLDEDGDLDLVIVPRDEPAVLLRNNRARANKADSILITATGTKGARDALGARVTVRVNTRTLVEEVRAGNSFVSRSDLRLHFGLGSAQKVDSVRVRWPDGTVQEFGPAEGGFSYRATEGGKLESVRRLAVR